MKHTEEQLRKLQTIRMTDVERVSVRTALIDFMESTSPSIYQRIPSPFFRYWTPVMVTMCSFAFVIFGGSAVAYNASSSLPGDFLYNFKVHVNEEVAGIFIKSDLEKITFQQYRVAKRIEEVKKLAVEGELTAENAAIAEKNIDLHIAKIDESAKALAVTDLKEFVEVAKGLEPILDAHEKDLAENVKEALVGPGLEKLPEEIVQAPTMAVDPTATVDTKINTKPVLDTIVTPVEKTPTIQATENKVVDSIISKVEKESKILKEIAKQPIIIDKKEVKDTTVKTESQKEIVPTTVITQ